jgi:homoserine O-acetyltransferase
MIGVGKLIDTSQFYVIAVENIGNGVSTSASNSKAQHGRAFPQFSMRDMVNAQYLLLTRELHLSHIKAVVGVSLGGMQAFQWMVSYPEFIEKAVPIQGSPRPTSSDLLLWQSELMSIEADHSYGDTGRGMKTVSAIHRLNLFTPAYISMHTIPEKFPEYLAGIEKAMEHFNPYDWECQLRAIKDLDIYRAFDDSPEKTASAVKARALVIVSKQDHMVNPEPSRVFSKLINAKLLEFDSDCGHELFLCETEKLRQAVMGFLNE